MFTTAGIIKALAMVLSGVGVSNMLDRFVKPSVPPQFYPEKISPRLSPFNIIWLVASFIASFMLLNWLGRALNIQVLKKRI